MFREINPRAHYGKHRVSKYPPILTLLTFLRIVANKVIQRLSPRHNRTCSVKQQNPTNHCYANLLKFLYLSDVNPRYKA